MTFILRNWILAAAALALLSGCEPPAQLAVTDGVVKMSPVNGRPAAGYFLIKGGPQDVRLLSVTSPDVIKLEMHDTVQADGTMQMRQIYKVDVPARSRVAFEPGSKHLMLWKIGETAQKRGSVEFEFVFSNGDRILADARLERMGDEMDAPMVMDHEPTDRPEASADAVQEDAQ